MSHYAWRFKPALLLWVIFTSLASLLPAGFIYLSSLTRMKLQKKKSQTFQICAGQNKPPNPISNKPKSVMKLKVVDAPVLFILTLHTAELRCCLETCTYSGWDAQEFRCFYRKMKRNAALGDTEVTSCRISTVLASAKARQRLVFLWPRTAFNISVISAWQMQREPMMSVISSFQSGPFVQPPVTEGFNGVSLN